MYRKMHVWLAYDGIDVGGFKVQPSSFSLSGMPPTLRQKHAQIIVHHVSPSKYLVYVCVRDAKAKLVGLYRPRGQWIACQGCCDCPATGVVAPAQLRLHRDSSMESKYSGRNV